MTRAAFLVAVMALAPTLPEGCAKALGKNKAPAASASAEPTPPPTATAVASVTATATATALGTAPPIWAPPEPSPPPSPEPTESTSPDLAKAKELAEAGEHKKVRALLEKRVKAGKGSDEEASLLLDACVALRDKACIESVKAKHPSLN
ncbi:MAG: hypothetical protein KF894_11815 [Labilithrix sp.]|nr:hypothetical protein [Labilithrix sp.]